jgi:peroxiredoxin
VHELEALQTVYADIAGLGASLVVISPELRQRTSAMAARHKLTFPILWDEQSKVADAFGLAFTVPGDLKTVYLGFGNDLAVRNSDPSWRLPVPARFVIDAGGIVRSVQADPDYTHRPEPETTVDALRKVVGA